MPEKGLAETGKAVFLDKAAAAAASKNARPLPDKKGEAN